VAPPPDDDDSQGDSDGEGPGEPEPGDDIVEDGERVEGEVVDDDAASPGSRRVFAAQTFSGPLPPPESLQEYDNVVPGLAREIVDQWKDETAHRHKTIDGLRATDREAMRLFHEGEKRGQRYALAAIVLVLAVVVISLLLDRPAVGIAGILVGGGTLIWALRRRSNTPDDPQLPPADLGDGDHLERPAGD
jgi:uncharacterized membrane protein